MKNLLLTIIMSSSVVMTAKVQNLQRPAAIKIEAETFNKQARIIVVNGKLYKYKNGKFFPLVGIVLTFVKTETINAIKEKALNFVRNLFLEKDIPIVEDKYVEQENVEEIEIDIEDQNGDRNYEILTSAEDHVGNGEDDNKTELHEFSTLEEGLEQNIMSQIEFFDQFYQGDLDGDGTEE